MRRGLKYVVVKEPDKNEYYVDEYVFDDDLLLTPARRGKLEDRDGSGIVAVSKNQDGSGSGGGTSSSAGTSRTIREARAWILECRARRR